MGPEDRLVILSDHGFTSYRRSMHLNRWLANAGLLHLQGQRVASQTEAKIDWKSTKAYAVGLNGIFINRQGREGEGIVTGGEINEIKRRIQNELPQFRDPANGEPIVLRVYDSAEIYSGIHQEEAPDLLIGYARGYRASWQTALGLVPHDIVEDNTNKWSGDHCVDPSLVPGVLFTSFKTTQKISSITDIAQIVHEAYGAKKPAEPDAKSALASLLSRMPSALFTDLPLFICLIIWAACVASLSLVFYYILLDSPRLSDVQIASAAARRELVFFDGPNFQLWHLIAKNYRLAGIQLWLTFLPALLSSLPAIFAITLVAHFYDHTLPSGGDRVAVELVSAQGHSEPVVKWEGGNATFESGRWLVTWPKKGETVRLVNHDGTPLLVLPTPFATDQILYRQWWSVIASNLIGPSPALSDLEEIRLDMPVRDALSVGPAWARQTSICFSILLVAFSLLFKLLWDAIVKLSKS